MLSNVRCYEGPDTAEPWWCVLLAALAVFPPHPPFLASSTWGPPQVTCPCAVFQNQKRPSLRVWKAA